MHELGDEHEGNVGTDLARRAPARPDALTPTLAPRVARSLARFKNAKAFNQDLNSWDTSKVTTMSYMWVLTSPAVRSPDALSLTPTLAPRVARSLARFVGASYFNKPLNSWDTSKVKNMEYMWVLTAPAVRSPAPSRSRSLRASLARSPGSASPVPSTSPSIAGTRVR